MKMGKYLDLDDVVADNPKAKAELDALRDELAAVTEAKKQQYSDMHHEIDRLTGETVALESAIAAERQKREEAERYALQIADDLNTALSEDDDDLKAAESALAAERQKREEAERVRSCISCIFVQQVIVLKERAEALAAEVKKREEAVLKAAEKFEPLWAHGYGYHIAAQSLADAARNLRGEK
jgi:chromosome segregation ATPase